MLAGDSMEACEMTNLIKDEGEEEETHFYQAAFDSFDWNHSGRIATSVRHTCLQHMQWFLQTETSNVAGPSVCPEESWTKSH